MTEITSTFYQLQGMKVCCFCFSSSILFHVLVQLLGEYVMSEMRVRKYLAVLLWIQVFIQWHSFQSGKHPFVPVVAFALKSHLIWKRNIIRLFIYSDGVVSTIFCTHILDKVFLISLSEVLSLNNSSLILYTSKWIHLLGKV